MWECGSCNRIEYGEFPPEECNKCWGTNSFTQVPEDMVEEIKDHVLEDIRSEKNDDAEDNEEQLEEALK